MQIFLITLCYFLILGTGIALVFCLRSLSKMIKANTMLINTLNVQIYNILRNVQYKSKDICKYIKKLLKEKNTILPEVITTIFITLLPFKKLKSLLLLNKLFKKLI